MQRGLRNSLIFLSMTPIEVALVGAARIAASRIVDADDILEFDMIVNINHSQGNRNVNVHAVALADGNYSVENVSDVESINRGEITL